MPAAAQEAAPTTAGPAVSIVTPSLNQGRFLARTIESVLAQRYFALEYIVQDGGSTDSTLALLDGYGDRLANWQSAPDSGQADALNKGFARTSGDIMGWLNSDDVLLPGALSTVVQYFEAYPAVDVVYGNRVLIDEYDQEIGRWVLPGHSDAVLRWVDFVPQETMFWRRRVWDAVGGHLDAEFAFAMDWDLLTRLQEVGARFAHIPSFLGAFRVYDAQKTCAQLTRGKEEMARIQMRTLGYVPTRAAIMLAVAPYMLRHVGADWRYRIGAAWGASARL